MVTGDAILGAVSVAGLAALAGGLKLSRMLGRIEQRIESELSHNGGSSLKDQARAAKHSSERCENLLSRVQYDVSNLKLITTYTNLDRERRDRAWIDILRSQGLRTPDPEGLFLPGEDL